MSVPSQVVLAGWEPPTFGEILRRPIPDGVFADRCLIRGLALLGRRQIREFSGLEHVSPANDPFILALNHSTRREALLVPAFLMLYRGGRLIHFMADWNFRLIPGIGLVYQRARTITVTRKSARPRILNLLKPLYLERLTVIERARACLFAGISVGIFPEGRINRDRDRLLRGRTGAAYLSLQTGVPIIPAGIRLPNSEPCAAAPRVAAASREIDSCVWSILCRPYTLGAIRIASSRLCRPSMSAIFGSGPTHTQISTPDMVAISAQ